ncbi:hypothetical protein BCR39DRAFT_569954 [Naematelia encephala]|uniref:Zn(2)-C6 fungal-type domain-containing protein n=1 Tax=Naematelia encephala TaxID=71784 RepID=A0A1Y2AF84_9TREE|nr:hypothetical protein BCR39DRAFT_569954 [Naematelia encephala]
MSRPPPSSAYPPLPPGGHQIPPFPQLLHIKDEPHRTGASTPVLSQSEHMSPEEYDEIEDHNSPTNPRGTGAGGKDRKPHATRRRVVQSCSECRRRKIKCDKKFPCGPCVLRNDQARCHEVGMLIVFQAEKTVMTSPSNYASTADLAHLAHRLDALESSLLKSGALLPADLEQYLKNTRTHLTDIQDSEVAGRPVATARDKKTLTQIDNEEVDDTEGAALTLEHLAFGRSRVDGSHSLPHFGARMPSTVSRLAPNNDYHLNRGSFSLQAGPSPGSAPGRESPHEPMRKSSLNQLNDFRLLGSNYGETLSPEERGARIDALLDLLGPLDVFDLFYRKTDVAMRALTKVLPSRERGELLVNAYLDRVDWLHRCLHVPTFMRQCNDLWALPTDLVVHEISLPFVALYFTVCTLGLLFMETAESNKHFSHDEAVELPDLWFNAARSAMWAADFMGCHTTEGIQSMVLLGVYLNNRDRGEAAWAMLGAGIKMAQGLGLSRLGAEQQSVDGKPLPMWTGRWGSLIQREVGRRIWWNLVFLDWALAPSYNFSCSIQPDQIKTALPANIEDEDIIDDQPLKPQPMSVRTRMSFQLARLKFAEISHRQIWQANNHNHPPYSFILSVDGELRKAMIELPAFFQPDSSAPNPPANDPKGLVQYYEKVMLNLAIHSRMLRLHRPWLSRGYEDERFAYSKEQCIRAARASLRMMSKNDGTASFLEKWWIPLFYVSVSGLVIIIDLLRTAKRDMNNTETVQKITEVKGALDQMRQISDVSHPSRAAVKVMDFLLAEVEERRQPGSTLGKRKASPGEEDDESGLQRAVKKLIRQAQLESDSPSQSTHSGTTPTNDQSGLPSFSPRSGQMDMRIFSDTPRDRPVFDAYPMPGPPAISAPAFPDGTNSGGQNGANSLAPAPPAYSSGTSPFTFPIDPTVSSSYPPTFFTPTNNPPALDPAVESMLQSYFPTPTPNQQMPLQQAPDDFLSRVFNFGWENGNQNQNGGGQAQTGIDGSLQNNGNLQPGQPGAGQGAGQGSIGGGGLHGTGQQNPGFSSGAFEGWGTHGWMA